MQNCLILGNKNSRGYWSQQILAAFIFLPQNALKKYGYFHEFKHNNTSQALFVSGNLRVMSVNLLINGNTATISVSGRFAFEDHREFRKAYQVVLETSTVRNLDIDLSGAASLDTAALGMLLILKERTKEVKQILRLINCSRVVQQTLVAANFNKIFTITNT